MTLYMWIATAAWLLLILGYVNQHDRQRHVPAVLLGITVDLALVLYLQVTRNAIGTAVQFKLGILEQGHIIASTIALVLYFPVLGLGFMLLRSIDRADIRLIHRRVATTALAFRTLGFLLMFSMWK